MWHFQSNQLYKRIQRSLQYSDKLSFHGNHRCLKNTHPNLKNIESQALTLNTKMEKHHLFTDINETQTAVLINVFD